MPNKLLITDLDNTLYDWVTFFTQSFRGMAQELNRILDVPEEQLLSEFRALHQSYGNSEQPFAALDLPSLRQKFPGLSRAQLAEKIDAALHRFNSIRKETLRLYPGVADSLKQLSEHGVKIVGHTEAMFANAYWRLRSLGIDGLFMRLYTLEGKDTFHTTGSSRRVDPPTGFLNVLPREERKPNPAVLADICAREGAARDTTYYIGDSIVRDIAMARQAGVRSIWARYGTVYDAGHWSYLVKVTHWTEDDVRREKDLKSKYGAVSPDFTVDAFNQIVPILLG